MRDPRRIYHIERELQRWHSLEEGPLPYEKEELFQEIVERLRLLYEVL
jgi:hypothetical protein